MSNLKSLRADFPILTQQVNGHPLIYVDNAATTQKPQSVIDAELSFYTKHNANINRGVYQGAEHATQLYEAARGTVARFINAHPNEIVFTKGTTESINFVATAWALEHIKAGDELVLTELEHHANLIPWQQVAKRTGARLRFIPILPDGTLDMSQVNSLITQKTKLVACTHASNVLGTHVDIKPIIDRAHEVGALTLIDAAQSAPHQAIDVHALGCDFLVFSGHKLFGPTGIGILYIKQQLHDRIEPYQFGGSMVYEVDWLDATWAKSPQKFEAGTPPIAQAIGLGAAISYLEKISFSELQKHEAALCAQAIEGLQSLDDIRILGPIDQLQRNGHLVSFVKKSMHAHDVAAYLNSFGIAVRAGNHCAQPLAKKLSVEGSTRLSFYAYNTHDEVDFIISKLKAL